MGALFTTINSYAPLLLSAIILIFAIIFFLYGFALLTEGVNTVRNTTHPLGPSVAQTIGILGIGYLLLAALLWAVALRVM